MDWDFELGLNCCFELSDCGGVWILYRDSLESISTANSEHHIAVAGVVMESEFFLSEFEELIEEELPEIDGGSKKILPEI